MGGGAESYGSTSGKHLTQTRLQGGPPGQSEKRPDSLQNGGVGRGVKSTPGGRNNVQEQLNAREKAGGDTGRGYEPRA